MTPGKGLEPQFTSKNKFVNIISNITSSLGLSHKRGQVHPITNTSNPIRTYCLTNVTLLLDVSKSTPITSPATMLPDKISLASGVSISV